MIFKRFYKVLLLQQEGNCPQTANVSYIHVLLAAIGFISEGGVYKD